MAPLALILSVVLILASPLLERLLAQRWHNLHRLFMASLAGIVCLGAMAHLGSQIFKIIGWWTLPFVILGVLFVWASERLWIEDRFGSKLALVTAIFGVIIHSLTDGAIIAFSDQAFSLNLIVLVVIHQIPVGVFLWSQTRLRVGPTKAWITPVGMSLAILCGFFFAQEISLRVLGSFAFVCFEAFFLGSLIHIALDPFIHGRKTSCHCDEHEEPEKASDGSPFSALAHKVDGSLEEEMELRRKVCNFPTPKPPFGNAIDPRIVIIDDTEFIREAWLHLAGQEAVCCFASPFDFFDHLKKNPEFLKGIPSVFVDFDYGFGASITGKDVARYLKRVYHGRIVLYSEMDVSDWSQWFDLRLEKKIFTLEELTAQGL